MKHTLIIFCLLFLIMLTVNGQTNQSNDTNQNNVVTFSPDNTVSTNENLFIKEGPILDDIRRNIDMSIGEIFSINLSATNLDSYIRIMNFSPNLEFVNFTRELTRAFVSFRTLETGIANLEFQIDNETNIIQRHYYTINITNIVYQTNEMPESPINTTPNMPSIPNIPTPPKTYTNRNTEPNITPNTQTNATTNTLAAIENAEDIKLYQIANELYKTKSYNEALNNYNALITKYPESIYYFESIKKTGDIYKNQYNYSDAFNQYKKIYDLPTSDITNKSFALYSMGLMTYEMKDNEKSLTYFLEALKKYPETEYALNSAYMYSYILDKSNKGKDTLTILNEAINKNIPFSKKEDAFILLASIYEKARNYEQSYNTYELYLKEYPKGKFIRDAKNRMTFLKRNFLEIK